MKKWILALVFTLVSATMAFSEPVAIFDGRSFAGWEGDTNKTWRIADGAIVGGSLKAKKVPHNQFLCTTRQYTNFILRLQVKLLGTEGFVNGGVQFRSQRIPNHFEVKGYQADVGEGWWGCLYDESRRNKVLAKPDAETVKRALKPNEWNDYELRCDGRHIVLSLNGVPTVDYTEPDEKLPQFGIIGVQVHGDGITEVSYRNIKIEELP